MQMEGDDHLKRKKKLFLFNMEMGIKFFKF